MLESFKTRVGAFFSKPRNVYITYGVVAVTLVGIVGAIFWSVFNTDPAPSDVESLSDEDKKVIISKILENNPKGLIDIEYADSEKETSSVKAGSSVASSTTADGRAIDKSNPATNAPIPAPVITGNGDVDPMPVGVIVPDPMLYNYRITEVNTTVGEGAALCGLGMYEEVEPGLASSSEYSEFFDDTHMYYKYFSNGYDGILDVAYLTKYGNDVSDYYIYKNGDFAVRHMNDIDENFEVNDYYPFSYNKPESYPDSYQVLEQAQYLEYMYGSLEFVDSFEENGHQYYILQGVNSSFCEDGNNHAIISQMKVNADNYYQIENVAAYVDYVEDESMIYEEDTNIKTEPNVSIADVKYDFTFEDNYNVEVRDVNWADYTFDGLLEAKRAIEYIGTLGYQMFYIDLEDADLLSIYGKDFPERVENERYYYEEDFYEEGSSTYAMVMEYYRMNPLVEISQLLEANSKSSGEVEKGYKGETKYVFTSMFDTELTLEEVYYNNWGADFNNPDQINTSDIVINGQSASNMFKVYDMSYVSTYPSSYPLSYPTSYPSSYPQYLHPSYLTISDFNFSTKKMPQKVNYTQASFGSEPESYEGVYFELKDVTSDEVANAIIDLYQSWEPQMGTGIPY